MTPIGSPQLTKLMDTEEGEFGVITMRTSDSEIELIALNKGIVWMKSLVRTGPGIVYIELQERSCTRGDSRLCVLFTSPNSLPIN